MRRVALALAALLAQASAGEARADDDPFGLRDRPPERPARPRAEPATTSPCPDPLLAAPGVPLDDAGVGRPRPACVGEAVVASLRGLAAIDRPDFYGTLAASWLAEVRTVTAAGVELMVGARLVDARFAQNAVSTADEVGGGPILLGAARGVRHHLGGRPVAVLHSLRLAVPWTDSTRSSPALVAVPAVDATWTLAPRLAVNGRAALILFAAWPEVGGVDSRGALSLEAGAAARAGRFGFALGAVAQVGSREIGLDWIGARGAARVRLGRAALLELGGAARVAGRDRTDLAVELGLAIAP